MNSIKYSKSLKSLVLLTLFVLIFSYTFLIIRIDHELDIIKSIHVNILYLNFSQTILRQHFKTTILSMYITIQI